MHSIPPITENPVRFLGRTISDSLSDRNLVDSLSLSVTKGLGQFKTMHRPVQKLWIMQHLLLPWLLWPLLIYEIPMTTAVKLEQKISNAIQGWLHLHNFTTIICLYSTTSLCPLPIKSFTSITKSAKLSAQLASASKSNN